MGKKIELRNKNDESLVATYDWDTFLFVYNEVFLKRNGDALLLTDSKSAKQFNSLPSFFMERVPPPGSPTEQLHKEQTGYDSSDLFMYIIAGSRSMAAYYYFKGVEE